MWILDAEGDALSGNRYWLRPGQEYTLGRSAETRIPLSAFKTVSKTHITITVGGVAAGSSGNVKSRPSLKIKDHDSRFGTWLNGTVVKGETIEVTSAENTVKLAKMPENMRIRWEPIVFTNAGSRATKIKQLTDKMEPFGIKFVKEYTDETTYVMGPKLNTAKGLQALIHRKHIVTDLFADSLNAALSQSTDVLDPDSLPDPTEFRPTTDEYPPESMDPNPARAEIFRNITFIFLDEGQYNNLISPISAGLGKALVFDPTGKRVGDLVGFASSKGQVLLVRRSLDGTEDTLCIEAARKLGYEAITQSSLMGPVIMVDRTLLFKPAEVTSQSQPSQQERQSTPESSTTLRNSITEVPDSVERPPTQPPQLAEILETPPKPKPVIKKLKPRVRAGNTQVDLFDDFFKTSPKQSPSKISPRKSQRKTTATEDLFPDFSSPIKPAKPTAPIPEEEEEEEENYAPTAKEMLTRLAKNPASAPAPHSDDEHPNSDTLPTPTKRGKKRPAPEDDEVIAAAREHKRRQLEEKQRLAEELAAAVRDHEHLKNLGVVETFPVDLARKAPGRESRSERWDPAWNGRKNFKKFRRVDKTVSLGIGRQMIKLVDYKGKSAASQGDFFFVEPESRSGNSRVEDSMSDLSLTPVKSAGGKKGTTSRTSTQRSRSSKGSGRHLFVQDEDSDNDLGF